MIEVCAARLFNLYFQHTNSSSLETLQDLTEEAYKLHERLRKHYTKSNGLFDLDEFLLLKALRNYSVHQGEFVGEAFGIDNKFARSLKLDLLKVCLISKAVVKKAINYEPRPEYGEMEQIKKINSQLIDFGGFYNIEPIVFNFMVKVYEKLGAYKLEIPGKGFSDLKASYKKETHYNFSHFVQLQPVNVDAETVLKNLIPIKELNLKAKKGLSAPEKDMFADHLAYGGSEINLQVYDYVDIEGEGEYSAMRNIFINKITSNEDALLLAKMLPSHVGIAFTDIDDGNGSREIKTFHISKQKAELERNNIKLDDNFYQTTANEVLVLFVNEGIIFPVIIYKAELILISNDSPAPLRKKMQFIDPHKASTSKKTKLKRKHAKKSRKLTKK